MSIKRIARDTHSLVIELSCETEHERIEGNCSAIDPETDAANEQWIREQLAAGNEWAWCLAHVKVTYIQGNGDAIYVADQYLGCCSYASEADFKRDGYFDDMVSECISNINAQLSEV